MFIYLLQSNLNDIISYKIGITKNNIDKRIKQLQTGNPSIIKLISSYHSKYATMVEPLLHSEFKKYNISGEWFSSDSNLNEILFIEKCIEFENRIIFLAEENNWFKNKFKKQINKK